MNTVPIYEAKNKLPLFMHQAEESGPVFISRRNKTVGVILSFEEYKRIIARSRKDTILDRAAEFRKKVDGLFTNEDIDRIFDVRDHSPQGTSWENDVFKGVFDD
ncbi:MAG: type II toxin-antitoxin system Phd/YefM family antitoxin [Treponema sp.]|nr:type II toxin-antitoxin system Phd/YefM family antitoxin [Treponema sp.]